MKTWTLPAAALVCILLLLPLCGQGQAPSVKLVSSSYDGFDGVPYDDGSLFVGPLSIDRDGVSVPVFDSISVSRFDYVKISSSRDTDRFLGDSATLTRYDSAAPVVKITTEVANDIVFDLASDAGSLTGERWVMAGSIGATADLFILGAGSFDKSADVVSADLSPGDDLYLRVRRPSEPFELTSGVATGQVSGEAHVSVAGNEATASFVPYEDVSVTPIRAGADGGSFAVSGSEGSKVIAVSLDGVKEGARVSVDGSRIRQVSSSEALFGDEAVCWLRESGGSVYALVYLPHMSLHTIDISSGSIPAEAFTIASALAAVGGLVVVATATVWLFRK